MGGGSLIVISARRVGNVTVTKGSQRAPDGRCRSGAWLIVEEGR